MKLPEIREEILRIEIIFSSPNYFLNNKITLRKDNNLGAVVFNHATKNKTHL